MTTTAMPELPEPELGYIETDKSRQPAFSARQMREALQSAQPAAVSDDAIYAVWTQHCQKPGTTTRQLVCGFARAIPALRPQADHPDTARCIKARNDLNAAMHGEGALIDDLEHAVANACAKLLRPQAVPMTDEQVDRIWNALPMGNGFWLSFARAVEAHHGITQRADGGEAS